MQTRGGGTTYPKPIVEKQSYHRGSEWEFQSKDISSYKSEFPYLGHRCFVRKTRT